MPPCNFGSSMAYNPIINYLVLVLEVRTPPPIKNPGYGPDLLINNPMLTCTFLPVTMIPTILNLVYFQLMETTWSLIGFHGNHNHINDVTSGRHLGFSSFQIFFIFELNIANGEKTTFSDWNLQNCQIHCKVVSI